MPIAMFSGYKWTVVLLAPLLLLMLVFFYIPVFQSLYWSFFLEPPFGGGAEFVGWGNFTRVLQDSVFWQSLYHTLMFMLLGSSLAVLLPLILALAADRRIRLAHPARNILIWPKAVAGGSIGVAFNFIFDPFAGLLAPLNAMFPGIWDPRMNGTDAFITLLVAHAWGGIPFNFMILLAGLQAVPHTLHQAAVMDGASPWRRILDIQLPFIMPQLFLTLVIEFTESMTSAFALVDTMTEGGPGGATTLLVYKIYIDGFKGYDLSGAATQTTLLMLLVILLTAFQFLYLERRIKYER